MASVPATRRRWRFYTTETGGDVVRKELDALEADDAAELLAEMKCVARDGFLEGGARHLHGDIWEVRADGDGVTLRALFAKEGQRGASVAYTLSLHDALPI